MVSLRFASEAGQLAGPRRPRQRAREHLFESDALQPPAQTLRVEFATFSERQISEASVLASEAPRCLAVPCKANDRKERAHRLSSSASSLRRVQSEGTELGARRG